MDDSPPPESKSGARGTGSSVVMASKGKRKHATPPSQINGRANGEKKRKRESTDGYVRPPVPPIKCRDIFVQIIPDVCLYGL